MINKPQPKFLKLKGVITYREITIVINCRTTHNCIDIVVAEQLSLFVYPSTDLTMMVTNGKNVKEVRKCHKISIYIRNKTLLSITQRDGYGARIRMVDEFGVKFS